MTCVQNNRSFFACERYIFSKNKHLTSEKSLKHVWQLTITTSNVTLEVPLLLLSEKCQNVVFFLVYKSLYSVQIREYTDQKKLRIWTLFTQWKLEQTSTHGLTSSWKTVVRFFVWFPKSCDRAKYFFTLKWLYCASNAHSLHL